jgi:hypothetical protein
MFDLRPLFRPALTILSLIALAGCATDSNHTDKGPLKKAAEAMAASEAKSPEAAFKPSDNATRPGTYAVVSASTWRFRTSRWATRRRSGASSTRATTAIT